MTIERVRVEIDAVTPDDVFVAYTDINVRWNGFATPAFDRSEAERVIAWTRRNNDEYVSFEWDGDTLIQTDTDLDETYVTRLEPDDNGRYPIGAFFWTWQLLDEDAPEGDDLAAWLVRRNANTVAYVEAANAALRAAYANGATQADAIAASRAAGDAAIEGMT